MKRSLFPIAILVVLSLACSVASGLTRVSATPTGESFDAYKSGTVARDVTYCTMDDVALKMDVYYPEALDDAPWPAVMYVHGGAWISGDKSGGAGERDIPALREAGFLVAAVNYRLAPDYKFPAMIEDVKCAVRYLRAHADEYNLDPERIGAWGGSAGGHLVSLLGTADESAGWEAGEYLDQSSRVQAVVDMFGPADLTRLGNGERARRRNAKIFGVEASDDPLLAAASPINLITPDDPPFLILHGAQDEVVSPDQSQAFYEALQAVGVPAQLVMVKNAGHGFKPTGGEMDPNRDKITQMVVSFFSQWIIEDSEEGVSHETIFLSSCLTHLVDSGVQFPPNLSASTPATATQAALPSQGQSQQRHHLMRPNCPAAMGFAMPKSKPTPPPFFEMIPLMDQNNIVLL